MGNEKKRIALIGGGPSSLFAYKRLLEWGYADLVIDLFEATTHLGNGMPYSTDGANDEHVTNVSGNEIPDMVTPIREWIRTVPAETLERFAIDPDHFNDYKVLPRLLFGQYLSAQFALLKQQADAAGIETQIHLNSRVTDIIDRPADGEVLVEVNGEQQTAHDIAIICTGHQWPRQTEGRVHGYFDSPYPPSKLALQCNHTVALRGASLTAIDAIRTLSRHNGRFYHDENKRLRYEVNEATPDFRIVLHSRNGLLPAIRFHLEDPHLSKDFLLSRREMNRARAANEGFLSLDYVFEKDFKEVLAEKDPQFYAHIKDMSIEDFVSSVMDMREKIEPFQLFKAEYLEAEQSIRRHKSIYWKELLATLSFAMNYPAKYFSAEDTLRLQKVLMPLIAIVIAFVPQSSCAEMIAMHDAGRLDLVSVGDDSSLEPLETGGIRYDYTDESGTAQSFVFETFVDCIGQKHLAYEEFPFRGLVDAGTVSPARLRFRSAEAAHEQIERGNKNVEGNDDDYFLRVPGIRINDDFQVVDAEGRANGRLYVMAVSFIGGFNPDYSGLDFCEEASVSIVKRIARELAPADRQPG